MKLSVLTNPDFQKTLNKLITQELPLKTAFKFKTILKNCANELAKYEETRTDGLKRYGNQKEDGSLDLDEKGNAKFSKENFNEFAKELNGLLANDVEVGSVTLSELGEKISLTAKELLALDGLILE